MSNVFVIGDELNEVGEFQNPELIQKGCAQAAFIFKVSAGVVVSFVLI